MGIRGSIQYGRVTYRRIPCAMCGQEFSCSSMTKYKKRGFGDTWLYYCSWHCFHEAIKPEIEAEKHMMEREEERYQKELKLLKKRQKRVYYKHRLEQTREKVDFYYRQRAEHKKGTPEWEHNNKLLIKWREKRTKAYQDLKNVGKEIETCTPRAEDL